MAMLASDAFVEHEGEARIRFNRLRKSPMLL
jgi:hypothetical protein